METKRPAASTIDEYIAGFPPPTQEVLKTIRRTIAELAPDAVETISYAIPTFRRNGKYLIYFAGYARHVGLYPFPLDHPELKDQVAPYASGKASVRFPLDQPLPLELIRMLVRFRLKESDAQAEKDQTG